MSTNFETLHACSRITYFAKWTGSLNPSDPAIDAAWPLTTAELDHKLDFEDFDRCNLECNTLGTDVEKAGLTEKLATRFPFLSGIANHQSTILALRVKNPMLLIEKIAASVDNFKVMSALFETTNGRIPLIDVMSENSTKVVEDAVNVGYFDLLVKRLKAKQCDKYYVHREADDAVSIPQKCTLLVGYQELMAGIQNRSLAFLLNSWKLLMSNLD
jgi:hypothetical protein